MSSSSLRTMRPATLGSLPLAFLKASPSGSERRTPKSDSTSTTETARGTRDSSKASSVVIVAAEATRTAATPRSDPGVTAKVQTLTRQPHLPSLVDESDQKSHPWTLACTFLHHQAQQRP